MTTAEQAKALIDEALEHEDCTNPMWASLLKLRLVRQLGLSERRVTWIIRNKLQMIGGLEGARRTKAALEGTRG